MRKLGFTLIELIVVIIIIGFASFLVIKLPKSYTSFSFLNLRDYLLPDGRFVVYNTGMAYLNKKKINLNIQDIEIYKFNGEIFKRVKYDNKIIFEYNVKNGIGNSMIAEINGNYYVFKPLRIFRADSFNDAKEKFLLKKYRPYTGNYY